MAAWLGRSGSGIEPFVLIGDPDAAAARAQSCGLTVPLVPVAKLAEAPQLFDRYLPMLPVMLRADARAGVPDAANAAATIAAIEMAVDAVLRGQATAVVTNPIAKSVLYHAGFAHPGHTEFLAALAERYLPGRRFHPVMMLASDVLRVVPLTVHIPLSDVPSRLSADLIMRTARAMAHALTVDFGLPRARIAVAGLNPHAGEQGTIGREDQDVINPAIAALKAEGLAVSGPHSADTLFHAAARTGYDAVLAMYHDQALIPIKTLAFEDAVNVTLGLPFVRTSPDHGTAFDIAGRGLASPASLIAALRMAADMAARRADGTQPA